MTTATISEALAVARMRATVAALDGAATPAVLSLYATPQPAGGDFPGGAAVVSIVLQQPCGVVSAIGQLSLHGPVMGQCVLAGDIAWGRVCDGDGNFMIDGAAGLDAATAFWVIDRIAAFPGAYITLTGSAIY